MMMFGSGVCITHAMLSRISAFFYVSSWIAGETRREMCMCVFMRVRSDTALQPEQLPAPPWSGGNPKMKCSNKPGREGLLQTSEDGRRWRQIVADLRGDPFRTGQWPD